MTPSVNLVKLALSPSRGEIQILSSSSRPTPDMQTCSTMRGRIKGTDSTINAILATAVLYELRWKIWNGAE